MTPPRLKLEEFLLAIHLERRPQLVVEGNTDRIKITHWFTQVGYPDAIITPVDRIEIPAERLIEHGLNDGARSRVIYVAIVASGRKDRARKLLRCIADRDCSEYIDVFSGEQLLWTDYPSLESYTLRESVFDRANELAFSNKLPRASAYWDFMLLALADSWKYRQSQPHAPSPDHKKCVDKKTRTYDITKGVAVHLQTSIGKLPRPTSKDPRSYAYGHDVAEILLALFSSELRKAGIISRDAVEGGLWAATLLDDSALCASMFDAIKDWFEANLETEAERRQT